MWRGDETEGDWSDKSGASGTFEDAIQILRAMKDANDVNAGRSRKIKDQEILETLDRPRTQPDHCGIVEVPHRAHSRHTRHRLSITLCRGQEPPRRVQVVLADVYEMLEQIQAGPRAPVNGGRHRRLFSSRSCSPTPPMSS